MSIRILISIIITFLFIGCTQNKSTFESIFLSPPEEAKPWTYWYWMHGALSKEEITADLESMKEAGLGGAYVFTIRGVPEKPLIEPSYHQLSPEWWDVVRHTISEAKRLDVKLGWHVSDGFALAGGPWITPENSMQKVVWSKTFLDENEEFNDLLPQPETNENYYQDIGVYAIPMPSNAHHSTQKIKPAVSTSFYDVDATVLLDDNNKKTVVAKQPGWIQYSFDQPFTCRSITVRSQWSNYQSRRLIVEVSDDGVNFRSLGRLQPPRMGWQDYDAPSTFAIKTTTAKHFRFLYDPEGAEPGSEDLDPAKWNPDLRISGLTLSGMPQINQYEGKSGRVWRITPRSSSSDTDFSLPNLHEIVNLTEEMNADGSLHWKAPKGNWLILRMGHTSTGHTNATGGAAIGLESDKLSAAAVQVQFENWFEAAIKNIDPETAKIITNFHVDSWECGGQNWTLLFTKEFQQRRGYDLLPYLPVMAGIAINSNESSEKILYDIRQTISELVQENFFGTLNKLSSKYSANFSAESTAPIFVTDGMEHFKHVNHPMGEFWLRSPSHDKPNDILDAISGAAMYDRNIVQAEAFTQVRMEWDEHPGMLKTLGDLYFAWGINKMVFHVYTHNPWPNKQPGMTLDGIGLYFQRDQTWWKPGFEWIRYMNRCQALLQQGVPVKDVAVFTGEELPRRAILPDRLVPILSGIVGDEIVKHEAQRLTNEGMPIREQPMGVKISANLSLPEDWVDPLNGYGYDSFNRDALLTRAKVKNGKITLPGGRAYSLLIIPGSRRMMPHGNYMSLEVAKKLLSMVNDGATIMMEEKPLFQPGLAASNQTQFDEIIEKLWNKTTKSEISTGSESVHSWKVGNGRVVQAPYRASSFSPLGIEKDLIIIDESNIKSKIAWNHRKVKNAHIYFISNQKNKVAQLKLSFRVDGMQPEIYHPVTGEITLAHNWRSKDGRTEVNLKMDAAESIFIVFEKQTKKKESIAINQPTEEEVLNLVKNWQVRFDPAKGGLVEPIDFKELTDWRESTYPEIKDYSGTAIYKKTFQFNSKDQNATYNLHLGKIADIAQVTLNGQNLGVIWTAPYEIEITKDLKEGDNILEIAITNTWRNRLLADRNRPETDRIADFFGRWYIQGKNPVESGLIGPVKIFKK